jgi:acetyl/propionyl-CoA carboxylase alpha subunit
MTNDLRKKMTEVAVEIGMLINYKCAGTVIFYFKKFKLK